MRGHMLALSVASIVILAHAGGVPTPAPPAPGSVLGIDSSKPGQTFHGIGGLSGGGATTRLLIDYPKVT